MCLNTQCTFIATFNHHFVFKTWCAFYFLKLYRKMFRHFGSFKAKKVHFTIVSSTIFWTGSQPKVVMKSLSLVTYQVRNQLQYSESFEDVVLNILVVGCIQECNILNLMIVSAGVFRTLQGVSRLNSLRPLSVAWDDFISCLHGLSTSGFHQSEHPKSLCCSAAQQVHYYVLICIYQVD